MPPSAARRRLPPGRPRALAIGLVALLLAGTFVGLGLERVPEGQVAVRRAGDGEAPRVWEAGWHWRLPWGPEPVRLPRAPVALERGVELTTAEGATLHFEVAGRFAVEAGREGDWLAAAGAGPFLDGLGEVVAEALSGVVRTIDPAEVFAAGAEERLTAVAARALAAAGLRTAGLTVTAPADANPVAAAVVRNQVAALARPTGTKVLLVGWDGADWLMIRPLLAEGRLPNLARLVEGGVSGDLRSTEPLLSPLLWTTIATGRTVTEHGVADFLMRDPATGAMVPITSASRKVHALWTLLPAFGLSTDVVAWWATWPAEPVRGTMVSDRVAYQLFELDEAAARDAAGKVHPASAWPAIEERIVAAEEVPWSEVRRFVDVPEDELERRWQALPPDRRQEDPVNHLRKILATTRTYHQVALSLLEQQADLTMVYYEGTDTVGHLFGRYLPPAMPGVAAADVARYGGALARFYEHADALLGELLDRVDDDTLVLLVSDHGFFTGEARPESDPSDFTAGAPQWHRQFGVIAGDGPGIDRGRLDGASIFDVAPTVLAALGLPVPEDFSGRVLLPLLPPAALRVRPEVGELASFEVLPRERPRRDAVASAEADRERLRELAALGYISAAELEASERRSGAATGGDPAAANGRGAAAAADLEAVASESYNLGRIAQNEGRWAEARRHYERAIEQLPSFGLAYASMAQVATLEGRHGEAFDWLARGFARGQEMPQAAVTGLVDEGKKAGRLDEAARVLQRIAPRYSGQSGYHAALGLLAEARGDAAGALAHYDRALAIDPLDQLAVEQKLTLLRRAGREREAQQFLDRSFAAAEGSVAAMNRLAVAALRQGWPAQAEKLLRRVLASDPGNPGVLANLAAALGQQGKVDEGVAAMRQALARDPDNAGNYFNLGAMLASLGRADQALEAFEAAEARGLRSPRLHVAAAKMHFRLGDRAASERELRRALALEPDDREAGELLAILRDGG
ncbi:MAG TPA: alkaline phosphatase family protein [Thermoanaerobaculia bacterium]